MSTQAIFQDEIKETTGVGLSDWAISERVLARWQCLVAFMKALDLLHLSMRTVVARGIVPPHRDGHRNGHQSGYISHCCCCCFVCYCPGGCRSDTEQVVTRWWHPVASSVALDMLHWAMLHVLLQRLRMAIEMASGKGAFFRCCRLFRLALS